jgi:MurNAc alpha-1-phosphate uridylyltransferase
LAHLVLTANPDHHPLGDFGLRDGLVIETDVLRHTFSGIGVYRAELFADCRPGKFPLAPLLRKTMAAGQVTGELYSGLWMDIGTPERLADYDQMLRAGRPGPAKS